MRLLCLGQSAGVWESRRNELQPAVSLCGSYNTYLTQIKKWAVMNKAQRPGFEDPMAPGQRDGAPQYRRDRGCLFR